MIGRRAALRGAILLLAVGSAAPAEAQFGRNKVQYRSFDFEVIKTEHFDVHFYPEEREAAVDAARMAERSYARLSRLLRHRFRERKPIIVYASHAHFQQTNALSGFIGEGTGGVTEALKDRVILPFTGSYADFDHVLTHELVHAFQFDVIFRDGFRTDGASVGRIPLWFMEGMAEYLAIGRVDPHTASWVRDAVMKGYIRGIREMNRRDDYLSYRFGQSLWAYIGERWGDEVVGVLLQKAPRLGVERAIASTLGLSMAELSRDWIVSIRSAYLPDLAVYDSPDRFAHRLTTHDAIDDPWFLAPTLSPDGDKLVFASQRSGFFMDLWLADGRTGEIEDRLIAGSRSAGFESLRYQSSAGSFSPDGRLVAFAAQSQGRDALYLYDIAERRVWRKLTFDLAGVGNPAWSPDGLQLVFTGLQGGLSDLYLTDLQGRLTRLTRDRHADLQPAWSPDGLAIAFATDRGPDVRLPDLHYGNFRVALLDLTTSRIEVLPHQEEGKNVNPVWSPDGAQLAWVGDRTGVNNLYLYDRDSRQLRQVSDLTTGIIGTNHLSPVITWARAADRMVFVHFEGAGYNLYAVDDPRALPTVRSWSDPPLLAAAEPTEPADPIPSTASDSSAGPSTVGDGFTASYYRADDGVRPSAALPPSVRRESGPLSVMELLDRGESALPDTGQFEIVDYQVRFTPDVVGQTSIGVQAGGAYGSGVYGGSYVSLSDMLGDHSVVLAGNLNGSLSDATFFGGYGRYRGRANVSIALQQVPYYRYRGIRSFPLTVDGETREVTANVFLRDLIRSVDGVVSYPFSTFRRIEVGARVAHFGRDNLYRGYEVETRRAVSRQERVGDLAYAEPSVALVFDNTLFGWTGPIHGRRYRLQLSHTAGDLDFTEALVDLRGYWSWRQTVVLAGRAVALSRTGADSDRFALFWGGPYFIRGYDGHTFRPGSAECEASAEEAGGESRSACPVRDQLIGASGAFLNAEMRFPVITELRLGPLGQFPPIDGIVFLDGGLAWDEHLCTTRDFDPSAECRGELVDVDVVWRRDAGQDPYLVRQPLFSWGVGLRLNILYGVIRMDYAFPLDRERPGVFSVAFGPSF